MDEAADRSAWADITPENRKITDADTLKALAHPMRIRLMMEIGLRGKLTATEASQIVGGTPAAAAYHLRTLAKHGFVEEAEGGVGRERPWRLIVGGGYSWDTSTGDAATRAAAETLTELNFNLWLDRLKQAKTFADQYPAEVRKVTDSSQMVLFVTPEEMFEVERQMYQAVKPFIERIENLDLRPEGSLPFEVVIHIHPLTPPDSAMESEV